MAREGGGGTRDRVVDTSACGTATSSSSAMEPRARPLRTDLLFVRLRFSELSPASAAPVPPWMLPLPRPDALLGTSDAPLALALHSPHAPRRLALHLAACDSAHRTGAVLCCWVAVETYSGGGVTGSGGGNGSGGTAVHHLCQARPVAGPRAQASKAVAPYGL